MSVETDASLRGWGAICKGVRTGGPWSIKEQSWHINCLELWAAMLAIQCYARDKKSITILLLMDNTRAVLQCICEQHGRNNIRAISLVGMRPVDVASSERHPSVSSTSPRKTECHSRCRVKSPVRLQGLDDPAVSIQKDRQEDGSTGSGFICIPIDSSASTVLQSETRSSCYSNQCIPTGLGSTEGICKPSKRVDRQSPITSTGANGRPGTSSTSLERSDMVKGYRSRFMSYK